MATSLDELVQRARQESRQRGFRSTGIYHLLWAAHNLVPESFDFWLQRYRVDTVPFVKMLENILRPRRAGGGIPRDRQDATLLEESLACAERIAAEQQESPGAHHLTNAWEQLSENPIVSLCERFSLSWRQPV